MENGNTLYKILIINKEEYELVEILSCMPEYAIHTEASLEAAGTAIEKLHPKVVLVDTDFTKDEMITFIQKFKSKYQDKISFMVTGKLYDLQEHKNQNNIEDEVDFLHAGVSDFIPRPYQVSILKLRIENQLKIQNLLEQLEDLATTDELTRLKNRRSFYAAMDKFWSQNLEGSETNPVVLHVAMLDIDFFKKFNDTYGHKTGDKVLQKVAECAKDILSNSNQYIFRFGGEEFIFLLYGYSNAEAEQIFNQIREEIAQTDIEDFTHNPDERITVSIGVFGLPVNRIIQSGITKNDAIKNADDALYLAKETGRNKVVLWDDSTI